LSKKNKLAKLVTIRVEKEIFLKVDEVGRVFGKSKLNLFEDFTTFAFQNFDRKQLEDFFLTIMKPYRPCVYTNFSTRVSEEKEKIYREISQKANISLSNMYCNTFRYLYDFVLKNPNFAYKKMALSVVRETLKKHLDIH